MLMSTRGAFADTFTRFVEPEYNPCQIAWVTNCTYRVSFSCLTPAPPKKNHASLCYDMCVDAHGTEPCICLFWETSRLRSGELCMMITSVKFDAFLPVWWPSGSLGWVCQKGHGTNCILLLSSYPVSFRLYMVLMIMHTKVFHCFSIFVFMGS